MVYELFKERLIVIELFFSEKLRSKQNRENHPEKGFDQRNKKIRIEI